MLLELSDSREKKSKASSHFPLYMCVRNPKSSTLCMGALGGLYRPTPQEYKGNLVGCRTRLSVSLIAGFSADCWSPPPGGPHRLVWYGADRPPPPFAGLAGC